MNICLLAPANSLHTQKWCKYLIRRGCHVDVLSLSNEEIDGVNVHVLGVDNKIVKSNRAISKFSYLFYTNEIKKLVKSINPDIVHAHYATSYGLLGALCNFKPYIISVWGTDVYDFPKRSLFHKYLLKYNLRKSQRIFSTSEAMAKETKLYTNKEIFVTPFGIDLDLYKHKNKSKSDQVVIGIVKCLEEVYCIDYLIKAFSIAMKKNKDKILKLKIVGEGTQKKYLKKLVSELKINDNVEFLGFLTGNDLVEAYNSFDIAAFPSKSESFGVAAIEAQACGLPVIVSDVSGLLETTKPGESSIVCKVKNIDSLAQCIDKLVNDDKLRISMGQNGIRYVHEFYDVNNNFDYIIELYKQVLEEYGKK